MMEILKKMLLYKFWGLETKPLSIIQSANIAIKYWVTLFITIVICVFGGEIFLMFMNPTYVFWLSIITFTLLLYLIVRFMLNKYLIFNVKLEKDKLSIKHYLLVILIIVGLYFISTATLYRVISYIPDFGFFNASKNIGTNVQALFINLLQIICTILIAPVIEEIIFRKIILGGLIQKYTTRTALVASTLIFAIFHVYPPQIIAVIPVAFIIGFIYLKTSSIMLCITAHAFHNLLCQVDNQAYSNFNNVEYLGVFIIGFLIIVFALKNFNIMFNKQKR
jgi:membrane protease YdiL (CAAX protease family)